MSVYRVQNRLGVIGLSGIFQWEAKVPVPVRRQVNFALLSVRFFIKTAPRLRFHRHHQIHRRHSHHHHHQYLIQKS